MDLLKFLSKVAPKDILQFIEHLNLFCQQKSFKYFQINLYQFANQHLITKIHLKLLYLPKDYSYMIIHIYFILISQF